MPIYTFRITYDDDESITRDIQIKPSQTVNELNRAIVAAYKIKNDYTPSLFISNDAWKKVQSLTGVSMDGVAVSAPDAPPTKGKAKTTKKKKEEPVAKVTAPSSKTPDKSLKLFDIINDPHQKLIAEYDSASSYAFHIELLGINVNEDKKSEYPLCSKSIGPSPFQNDDLRKYLDSRSKGEDGEEYALDKDEDATDEMGVETEAGEESAEDAAIDPEIADEFGTTEGGFEEGASDE